MPADTFKYNNISLGMCNKRTLEMTAVYSDDGRQITHHRLVINVEATIAVDVANSIEDVKAKLNKPGQELFIENCGFGNSLRIGGPSGTALKEVQGGPFPKVIRFDPLGATNESTGVQVVWQCEANVFFPSTAGASLGEIYSYTYGAAYSIDAKGWTTRTVAGRLKVRKEYVHPNKIGHNADQYREFIKIKKPEGFERQQSYDLSEDKSTLSFSITDTQIRTRQPYPPGVVEISCRHRVSRSRHQLATTRNSISFRCEVAANQPTAYAWFVFQAIVGKRIAFTKAQGVQLLIDEIEVEEEIFGTEFSASVSYHTLQDMGTWLFNAGVFQPVELSWDPWEQSVHEIEEHRGIANLVPDPIDQDRLVNLEQSSVPDVEDIYHPHFNWNTPLGGPLCNDTPPEEYSWRHFEAEFDLRQSALEREQWIPIGPEAVEDGVLNLNEIGGAGRKASRKEIASILAENPGYPTTLIFRGTAIRVGYEIPLPKLSIPGVKTKMIDKRFMPKFMGIFYCQPVYAAKWEIVYQIGDLPAEGTLKPGYNPDGTAYTGAQAPQPPP